MADSAEKIGTRYVHWARGHIRWLKRQSSKLMRRLWRKYGQDAPRKLPIRGWID